jgi:hypothetical protein
MIEMCRNPQTWAGLARDITCRGTFGQAFLTKFSMPTMVHFRRIKESGCVKLEPDLRSLVDA